MIVVRTVFDLRTDYADTAVEIPEDAIQIIDQDPKMAAVTVGVVVQQLSRERRLKIASGGPVLIVVDDGTSAILTAVIAATIAGLGGSMPSIQHKLLSWDIDLHKIKNEARNMRA